MKNLINILIIILIASLSFGFILYQKPESDKIMVENSTIKPGGHNSEIKVLNESNDDQW